MTKQGCMKTRNMMLGEDTLREKLRDLKPAGAQARASSSTFNAEFSLLVTIVLAIGEFFRGFRLDIDVTPTSAAGAGTAYIADMIKKITVKNEYGEVVFEADGAAGPGVAALFASLLNADEIRTSFTKNIVAATATSYNSWWTILQSARGSKFEFLIEFLSPVAALVGGGGWAVTACATTVGVSVLTSDEPGEQVEIEVAKRTNPERITDGDGLGYLVAADNTELSTVVTALTAQKKTMSSEQLKALENDTAWYLQGFGAAGAAGAVQYIPGVLSPNSANQLFAIALVAELAMDLNITFSGAVTAYYAKVKAAPAI